MKIIATKQARLLLPLLGLFVFGKWVLPSAFADAFAEGQAKGKWGYQERVGSGDFDGSLIFHFINTWPTPELEIRPLEHRRLQALLEYSDAMQRELWNEAVAAAIMSPGPRRQKALASNRQRGQEFLAERKQRLRHLLGKARYRRAEQIMLQHFHRRALIDFAWVPQKLQLGPAQVRQIDRDLRQADQAAKDRWRKGAELPPEQIEANRAKTMQKILQRHLTPLQLKHWKTLLGQPTSGK